MIKATEIFKSPKFSQEELDKIWAIAGGKTIYFNSLSPQKNNDPIPVLIKYARGENWRHNLPFSRRRFYQIRNRERKNFCFERILFWQEQGLLLKEIARIAGVSETTITKMRKGDQDV